MLIKWLGHSAFYLQSSKGSRVVIDPYSNLRVKRDLPKVEADVVLVSHEHADHNAVWLVEGDPIVIRRTGDFIVEREIPMKRTGELLTFRGYPSYHDKYNGKRYGDNTIWEFYMDNIHVVHLGDIGHLLRETELHYIKSADLLFVPISGGNYTVDAREATVIVDQLKALMVIPMHYKTEWTQWVKGELNDLLRLLDDHDMVEKNTLRIFDLPPTTKYYVFNEKDIEDVIEYVDVE